MKHLKKYKRKVYRSMNLKNMSKTVLLNLKMIVNMTYLIPTDYDKKHYCVIKIDIIPSPGTIDYILYQIS
jgi:hypothetical protein